MVHNVLHHAFFCTYSLSRHVHADEYDEIKAYMTQYGKWYMLKAEDVMTEGKVHLHFILFKDFQEFDPDPARTTTCYGPQRCGTLKDHIVKNCPMIAASIASHGSRYSMQCLALTSTQWVNYMNKETFCHVNNMPDDNVLIANRLSEAPKPCADPEMHADQTAYLALAASGDHLWCTEVPTLNSVLVYYGYQMTLTKKKKTVKRQANVEEKARLLVAYMTEDIYVFAKQLRPPPEVKRPKPQRLCPRCSPPARALERHQHYCQQCLRVNAHSPTTQKWLNDLS